MRAHTDKRSSSVTEEESINSARAQFLLCNNNTGKLKLSSRNVLCMKNLSFIYLFIYFVVHDLNLVILVLQVFVWNSILVTLIQGQG